jgi:hypothetical protein
MRTPLDRRILARLDEILAAAIRWRDELTSAAEQNDTAASVVEQSRLPHRPDHLVIERVRRGFVVERRGGGAATDRRRLRLAVSPPRPLPSLAFRSPQMPVRNRT